MTQSDCGVSVAPSTSIGWSPEKLGSRWNCLSKTTWARPRRKIDAPMVMMISVTTLAPRAGSIASLFSAHRPTRLARDHRRHRGERQRQPPEREEHGAHAAQH